MSQTQSGIMEVRKVVDDGLLLLGSIEDLRRRFSELDISFVTFVLFHFLVICWITGLSTVQPHPLLCLPSTE